jgi:malonate transporter and related proteins
MASALSTLFPIFGLMLAGYLCRKRGVLGPTSARELNNFVVWLALPALLFSIVARSAWAELYQPGFIAAFGIATALAFVLVFLHRRRGGKSIADSGVEAIAASYSNTGYVGIPLALLTFGHGAQAQATLASLIVVCPLFAMAVVVIETGLTGGTLAPSTVGKVLGSLCKNPLLIAPAAGLVFTALHWSVPASADVFLTTLGSAASPAALVSLGLFLAEKRERGGGRQLALALTAVKLVGLPLVAWWLAVAVFKLSSQSAQMVVLMAALPTGTGPFMLAEFYGREAVITSQTILWSTIISVATLSMLLVWVAPG